MNAAVCLISALSYHEITTQIPASVYLAVPRGSYHGIKLPTPVTVYRFDAKTFEEGLETHRIAEMSLRIYSPARTVVDCFKFRAAPRRPSDVALPAGHRVSRDKSTNVVASVLAKLRNNSLSAGLPLQQVLQQYAIKRFLYRVSKSTMRKL